MNIRLESKSISNSVLFHKSDVHHAWQHNILMTFITRWFRLKSSYTIIPRVVRWILFWMQLYYPIKIVFFQNHFSFQAHDTAVRSMIWSHNDHWMLTADHGGYVKYWQSNMNNVKMYQAHKEAIRGLRWDIVLTVEIVGLSITGILYTFLEIVLVCLIGGTLLEL